MAQKSTPSSTISASSVSSLQVKPEAGDKILVSAQNPAGAVEVPGTKASAKRRAPRRDDADRDAVDTDVNHGNEAPVDDGPAADVVVSALDVPVDPELATDVGAPAAFALTDSGSSWALGALGVAVAALISGGGGSGARAAPQAAAVIPSAPRNLRVVDADGDGKLDVTGDADLVGGTVTIKDPTGALHVTAVGVDGHFVLAIDPPSVPLGAWTATVTDTVGGGVSLPAGVNVVDVTPPPLRIEGAFDTHGVVQGQLVVSDDGGLPRSNDPNVLFRGTTEPGATIKVYDKGALVATVVADTDGVWLFSVPGAGLAEGEHRLSAQAIDVHGNAGLVSAETPFYLDLTPPDAPIIQALVDLEGYKQGEILADARTDESGPYIRGKAEPHSRITVYEAGTAQGSVEADADGYWELEIGTSLADGWHVLAVTATDDVGNVSQEALSVRFYVDTIAPPAPVIVTVMDEMGAEGGVLALDGSARSNDPWMKFSGTAEVGSTIIVMEHGLQIATVPVDENGNWTYQPGKPLLNGAHTFTMAARDDVGNVSFEVATFHVMVAAGAVPTSPTITNVLDDSGVGILNVPSGGATKDSTPTVAGTARPLEDVVLYDERGLVLGTTKADADGQWAITVSPALSEGAHTLTVTASDPTTGVVSEPTTPYLVRIDTRAPPTPTAVLLDNVAEGVGPITGGQITNDATPLLMGDGVPGSTITVSDGRLELGTTQVGLDGKWTFLSPELVDGRHTFNVTATSEAGVDSAAPYTVAFIVETIDVKVSINRVADARESILGPVAYDGSTNDPHPTVSGKAMRGGLVTLFDTDGTVLGTTVADGLTGAWSIKSGSTLGDGLHNLTASVTSTDGNTSARTEIFPIHVETGVPDAPTIMIVEDNVGPIRGLLAPDDKTDDITPKLSGIGEAGGTVDVYANGKFLGSAKVDPLGNWHFTPESPLDNGTYALTAIITDKAGNKSPESATWGVTIDAIAPSVPVIVSGFDDQMPGVGELVRDLQHPTPDTNDARLTFRGTGDANTVVILMEGEKELGRTTIDGAGQWSFTPTDALINGVHHISVMGQDLVGNVSAKSTTSYDFNLLAGGVPTAPAIDNVFSDIGGVLVSVSKGGTTDDTTLIVKGTAPVGEQVKLYDETGRQLGAATADVDGRWSIPTGPLTEGQHTLSITATDPVTGTISRPTTPYLVDIDLQIPTTTATLSDDVGQVGPIGEGATTDDRLPTLSGQSVAGALITVHDGVIELGTTKAAEDGTWSFTPERALEEGPHSFTATPTSPAGKTGSATTPLNFTVDASGVSVAIYEVRENHDGAPDTLVSSNGLTKDATPVVSGHATPGGQVTLLDTDGITVLGTATADAHTGNWTITPTLSEGVHDLSATVTTLSAPGEVAVSSVFKLHIDTLAPAAPTLRSVADDVGPVQGELENGDPTDDKVLYYSGTSEAHSTVEVFANGVKIGTTQADAKGVWHLTPASPLNDGDYEITAKAIDEAGNTSDGSDQWGVSVDTLAPAVPAIVFAYDNQDPTRGNLVREADQPMPRTNDAHLDFHGTGTAGTTIIVLDGGQEIGRTTVLGDGTWVLTPELPLLGGIHNITAQSMDSAGNVSKASPSYDFNLLAGGVPTAPAINNVIADKHGIVNVVSSGVTDDDTLLVKGTAQAGQRVTLYGESGLALGAAIADADGRWAIATPALLEGQHAFTATAVDPATGIASGTTSPYRVTVDFKIPTTTLTLTDDVGAVVFIGNGDTTDDALPVASGRTVAGAWVTLYDGIVEVGKTLADSSGNWSIAPTEALEDGPHSFTARVTNPAGTTGPATAPIGFTVDSSSLDVTIRAVIDDVGFITGPIAPNGFTDDVQPEVRGVTTPGGTVTVYDTDLSVLGTTVADAVTGDWSVKDIELTPGIHALTATVTVDGVEGDPSSVFKLNVDTRRSTRPLIETALDNVGPIRGAISSSTGEIDDSTPEFIGSAEPKAVVIVYDVFNGDEVVIGYTRSDDLGNWRFTPTTELSDGRHSIAIRSMDTAGNLSLISAPWELAVDTEAPTVTTHINAIVDNEGDRTGPIPNDRAVGMDDPRPVISGTAERNTTVVIYDGGEAIGSVLADDDGDWTFRPTDRLHNGVHGISAAAMDVAGNRGKPSSLFEFRLISGGVPTAPAITEVINNKNPDELKNIGQGQLTNDDTPVVIGTATAGDLVTLYSADATVLGTAIADAAGQWRIEAPHQEDGQRTFTVTSTNEAGNLSGRPTSPYLVIIDTRAPLAPAFILSDDVGPKIGEIHNLDYTDDATPTLNGQTTEPGGTIIVYDGLKQIGTTTINADGSWQWTPAENLASGVHSFNVVTQDRAGNVSEPSSITFYIDTRSTVISIDAVRDTYGPKQGLLDQKDITDDRRVTLSGNATPDSIVKVYDETNARVAQTVSNNRGEWTVQLVGDLPDGTHQLTATVTTLANQESAPTAAFEYTIDRTAPNQPLVTKDRDNVGLHQGFIKSNVVSDDTTPDLRGIAEANSTVNVYDGTLWLGATKADDLGNWRFTPNPALKDGSHLITVTATDRAGNTSVHSPAWVVLIDTVAPNPTTVSSIFDDHGAETGPLVNGAAKPTDDQRPTIVGQAEAGATVVILDGKVEIGRVVSGPDGIYTFVPEEPLRNGAHEITAYSIDPAGNVGKPSEVPFSFTLYAAGVPTAPTIDNVSDNEGPLRTIAKNGRTDDATPLVEGSATAGQQVTLYDYDGRVLGTTTSNMYGQWAITSASLAEGAHSLTVTATDPVTGAVSDPTAAYVLVVDLRIPQITLALTDNVGGPTPIVTGSVTDDPLPVAAGKTDPYALVRIYDGITEIAQVQADGQGNWAYRPGTALDDGPHSIRVTATSEAGKTSANTDPVNFIVDKGTVSVGIHEVLDNLGTVTGPVGYDGFMDDTQPTISGHATPGGQVSLYDGAVLLGTTVADVHTGEWSIRPAADVALGEGLHNLTATVQVAGSPVVTRSAAFLVNVDLTPPAAPEIRKDEDDVGPIQGFLQSGQVSDDKTATLYGVTEPYGVVRIMEETPQGPALLGTVTSDANGNWVFTTKPLDDGSHLVYAMATDKIGNESLTSNIWNLIVDTVAPIAPTLIQYGLDDQGPAKGHFTNDPNLTMDDARPGIGGKAQAGSTLVFLDDGVEIGRALVDGNGDFYFTPLKPLINGAHNITAYAVDEAGNVGATSGAFQFQVLTGGVATATSITAVVNDKGVHVDIPPNGFTNDKTPRVEGTAQPGATVVLFDENGTVLGTVVAGANGRWHLNTPELSEGPHTLTARSTAANGDIIAPTGPYAIHVDTIAPAAPAGLLVDNVEPGVGLINDGTTTNDRTPLAVGTAVPLGTVTIYDGIHKLATVPVDGAGNWQYTASLQPGPHSFTYVAIDPAGNASAPTAPVHFVVDTSDLLVSIDRVRDDQGPVVGSLQPDAHTDDRRPEVSGSAVRGGTVTLHDIGGKVLGTAIADVHTGEWTIQIGEDLSLGLHTLTATVKVAGQAESAPTAEFQFHVEALRPAAPTIVSVIDSVGAPQGTTTPDAPMDDNTSTITGVAPPDATVDVYDNGEYLGTVKAASNGYWTLTPGTALNQGTHTITATATDAAGLVSPVSTPWNIVVDTDGSLMPDGSVDPRSLSSVAITHITTDTGPYDDDYITHDTQLFVGGVTTAADGTRLELRIDGVHIGYALVANGAFTFDLTTREAMTRGYYNFRVDVLDDAYNVAVSSSVQKVTIDTSGQLTPEGSVDPLSLQSIAIGAITVDTGPYDNDFNTSAQRVVFSGTSTAANDSDVAVYINDAFIGYAKVVDGIWVYDHTRVMLDSNEYKLSVELVDRAGNAAVAEVHRQFFIDPSALTFPGGALDPLVGKSIAITAVSLDSGVSSTDFNTNDDTPTFSGTTNADDGAFVNVYIDNAYVGFVIVANGRWEFNASLPTGIYKLHVSLVDLAGNIAVTSATQVVTIDPSGATLPGGEIDLATNNVIALASISDDTGPLSDFITKDRTLTYNGTTNAADDTYIEAFIDGRRLGYVQAAGGRWTITDTQALDHGEHNLTFNIVDTAGNIVVPGSHTVYVDLYGNLLPDGTRDPIADASIAVTSVTPDTGVSGNDWVVNVANVVIHGTSSAANGTYVDVLVDGGSVGRTTVSGGAWSLASGSLGAGNHTLSANVIDLADNVAVTSAGHSLLVDLTPPDLTLSGASTGTLTARSTIYYLQLSEAVYGLTLDDIHVTNGTASNLRDLGSNRYAVDVAPPAVTGNGTLTVSLDATAFTDLAGNGNSSGRSISQAYSMDYTPPELQIAGGSASNVRVPVVYTFTFSERVTDFSQNDISVTNGSITGFRQINDTQYEVTATPPSVGSGTMTLRVSEGTCHDNAGNENNTWNSISQGYQNDSTPPTLSISGGLASGNISGPTVFTFSFSEHVTDFSVGDIAITNGTLSNFQQIDSTHYQVTATPPGGIGSGTLSLRVNEGVYHDDSGNANTTWSSFNQSYYTGISNIDLGSYGNLIFGWQNPGTNDVYYYWDRNGDLYTDGPAPSVDFGGVAPGTPVNAGGDRMTPDSLDALFNGGANMRDGRYSTVLNGVTTYMNGISDPGLVSYVTENHHQTLYRNFLTSTLFGEVGQPYYNGSGGIATADSHTRFSHTVIYSNPVNGFYTTWDWSNDWVIGDSGAGDATRYENVVLMVKIDPITHQVL